jgi:3-oxo-5-alpha-steroid 4-dehydrogenase 1
VAVSERALFDVAVAAFVALGLATFVALLVVDAPYGRFGRRGFGPLLGGAAGWLLMESPAALVPLAAFLLAVPRPGPVEWVLLAPWELHYLYRAFVYPFRRRPGTIPALVVALGSTFNLVNGWLNGRWLSSLGPPHGLAWLAGSRFLAGLALFAVGLAVNLHSDQVLRELRSRGEGGYAIPQRGLHRLVASPNYLGELVEWIGFAVLTGSPAAAAFAFWTAANLVPRALANLRWYRRTFPGYPRRRRALIPFLL